jgi:hypothetical protein
MKYRETKELSTSLHPCPPSSLPPYPHLLSSTPPHPIRPKSRPVSRMGVYQQHVSTDPFTSDPSLEHWPSGDFKGREEECAITCGGTGPTPGVNVLSGSAWQTPSAGRLCWSYYPSRWPGRSRRLGGGCVRGGGGPTRVQRARL